MERWIGGTRDAGTFAIEFQDDASYMVNLRFDPESEAAIEGLDTGYPFSKTVVVMSIKLCYILFIHMMQYCRCVRE